MEAAHISEMSVNIYLTTRQYIPEDSELQSVESLFQVIACAVTCDSSMWM
jgi:hypothetical protein